MTALRKAVFWLVMLAIPVHGIAFTALPLHALGGLVTLAQQSDAEMGSKDAGMAAPHAGKDCAGMPWGCDFPHHDEMAKCGSAAACSFVAAPVPQLERAAELQASGPPLTTRPNPRIAFFTSAPERPPRSHA